MKPIYIYRPQTKSNKVLYLIGLILLILVTAALAAPFFLKSYVNKIGADEKGYAFRIGDIDINPLKSQIRIHDMKAFNIKSSVPFAELSDVKVHISLIDLLKNEKRVSLIVDEVNVTLSRDLFNEVNRIKNEGKEERKGAFYIDKIDVAVGKINVRDLRDDNTRTLLTLEEANIGMNDFGTGSINEKTEFAFDSKIAEGGKLQLKGKTSFAADNTPWSISGEMSGIAFGVIEKLAGAKLPLEFKETSLNIKITALSSGGQIDGYLEPDVKEFRIKEEQKDGVLKRSIAKATNFILNKPTEGDKEIKLEIPFTLNENFTVNFKETLKKLK